jgi:hypothetical protein
MPSTTWQHLLDGWPWYRGDARFPIPAYSEFIPPPRLGRKPYTPDPMLLFEDLDSDTWPVSEYEETMELRPGLLHIARQLVPRLAGLAAGHHSHGISKTKLDDNPYWPPELAARAGSFAHERFVVFMPLALSRTQDDKGRIRWTLFGASEQGPAKAFWRGFYSAPGSEWPEEQSLPFIRRALTAAYAEPEDRLRDLHHAGFRVLPDDGPPLRPHWEEGPLPSWTKPFVWSGGQHVHDMRYLLTFRPFGRLPPSVQSAYLSGALHLLPCPGSLIFWGCRKFLQLEQELPLATQIPLLQMFERHEAPFTIRIPQSGWIHQAHEDKETPRGHHHGPVRNTFRRTSRWSRVLRDEDELALEAREDKVTHVLFSQLPQDVGLYDKPLARNSQVWTEDFRRLLDGPTATRAELEQARHAVLNPAREIEKFGYRFLYPAMRVGPNEVYWHRPLVAYFSPETGQGNVILDAPLGYLTVYDARQPDLSRAAELWPHMLKRGLHTDAIELLRHCDPHQHPRRDPLNIRKLLDARQLLGDTPLSLSFARQLLTAPKEQDLEQWLDHLKKVQPDLGGKLADGVRRGLQATSTPLPEPLTYSKTSKRSFEVAYWKTIAFLADGKYITKNNADCVRDTVTQHHLPHHQRDLDALGDYLLDYYRKLVQKMKMADRAVVGDLLADRVGLRMVGRLAPQSRRPGRGARPDRRHPRP